MANRNTVGCPRQHRSSGRLPSSFLKLAASLSQAGGLFRSPVVRQNCGSSGQTPCCANGQVSFAVIFRNSVAVSRCGGGIGSARRGFVWQIIHSDMKGNTSVKQNSPQSSGRWKVALSDGAVPWQGGTNCRSPSAQPARRNYCPTAERVAVMILYERPLALGRTPVPWVRRGRCLHTIGRVVSPAAPSRTRWRAPRRPRDDQISEPHPLSAATTGSPHGAPMR